MTGMNRRIGWVSGIGLVIGTMIGFWCNTCNGREI